MNLRERRRGRNNVAAERPAAGEAVMFRDAEYGALVLEVAKGGLRAFNYGFVTEDARALTAALGRYCIAETQDDHTFWRIKRDAHTYAVLSTMKQEMRLRGYATDSLAERAIIVGKAGAPRPDLPVDDKILVPEAVEAGIRQQLGLVSAALRVGGGQASEASIRFYPRPFAESFRGSRPPFVVARYFVTPGAGQTLEKLRESVMQALAPWRAHLVKLSVTESGGKTAIEIGIAPSTAICEALMEASVPAFDHSNLIGARLVEFDLATPLSEQERADIEELGRACTGCIKLAQEGTRLVAQIPGGLPGNYGADHAVNERVSWLSTVLGPWRPELRDIGALQEVDLAPEKRHAELREVAECDEDAGMGGDDAANMVNGDVVATLASRFSKMPPAWWDTPQGEDALKKAKKLIKDEHGEEAAKRFEDQLELLRLTSSPTMKAESINEGATIDSNDIKPGFWFYRIDTFGEPQFSRVMGKTSIGWGVQYFRTSPRGRPRPSNRSSYREQDIIHGPYKPVPDDLMKKYKLDTVPPLAEDIAETDSSDAASPLAKAALGRTMLKAAGTFVASSSAKMDGDDSEEEKNVQTSPPKDAEKGGKGGDAAEKADDEDDTDETDEEDDKEAAEESVRPFVAEALEVKRDFEIAMANGATQVIKNGFVVGDVWGFEPSWILHHLPTGLRVGEFASKENALKAVEALATIPGVDWKSSNERDITRKAGAEAAVIIKKYGGKAKKGSGEGRAPGQSVPMDKFAAAFWKDVDFGIEYDLQKKLERFGWASRAVAHLAVIGGPARARHVEPTGGDPFKTEKDAQATIDSKAHEAGKIDGYLDPVIHLKPSSAGLNPGDDLSPLAKALSRAKTLTVKYGGVTHKERSQKYSITLVNFHWGPREGKQTILFDAQYKKESVLAGDKKKSLGFAVRDTSTGKFLSKLFKRREAAREVARALYTAGNAHTGVLQVFDWDIEGLPLDRLPLPESVAL